MAALNFPSSPTNGQIYTATGGSWIYESTKGTWKRISGEMKRSSTAFTNIGGDSSVSVTYIPGSVDVYLNGVKLIEDVDFTATNGTSISFTNAIVSDSDYVEVVAWAPFSISNVLSPSDASTSAVASTIAKRDANADLYANSFISSSDARLKSEVLNINNALDVIMQLQGVTYTYNETGKKSAGLIAQDLEKILPDLVHTNEDGIKSINYLGLIAYLIEAIKELRG